MATIHDLPVELCMAIYDRASCASRVQLSEVDRRWNEVASRCNAERSQVIARSWSRYSIEQNRSPSEYEKENMSRRGFCDEYNKLQCTGNQYRQIIEVSIEKAKAGDGHPKHEESVDSMLNEYFFPDHLTHNQTNNLLEEIHSRNSNDYTDNHTISYSNRKRFSSKLAEHTPYPDLQKKAQALLDKLDQKA